MRWRAPAAGRGRPRRGRRLPVRGGANPLQDGGPLPRPAGGCGAGEEPADAVDGRGRAVVAAVRAWQELRDDRGHRAVGGHRLGVRQPFRREVVLLEEAEEVGIPVDLGNRASRTVHPHHPGVASFEVDSLHAVGRPRLERRHSLHGDAVGPFEVATESREVACHVRERNQGPGTRAGDGVRWLERRTPRRCRLRSTPPVESRDRIAPSSVRGST